MASLFDVRSWFGSNGAPANGAPRADDPHAPSRGILSWLRGRFSGWAGPKASHELDLAGARDLERERVASGPQNVILPWFLPYHDPLQNLGETRTIRLAYRQMLADSNVKAAILGKVLSVGSLDLTVTPAGKGRQWGKRKQREYEEQADYVKWNLTERLRGTMPGLVWSVASGGLLEGYSVSEKVWDYQGHGEYAGKWPLVALKPKDVGNDVVLETDQHRNVVGVKGLRYNPGTVFSPAHFLLFRYLPLWDNPTGMSDLRAAYRAYWLLDTVWKLRAIHAEKHSMPVLMGSYTGTHQKDSVEKALAAAKSQTWIVIPEGAKAEALNIAGSAESDYANFVKDLKHDIFLGVSGAILQSLEGTVADGRGSSKVHRQTADLLVWYLASVIESLLNDRDSGLVKDLVDLNFVTDDYPLCALGAVDLEELSKELQIDSGLKQLGLKLSARELYDRYGRTPPDPDDPEDALEEEGGPGEPGGPGGGEDPLAGLGGGSSAEGFAEERKDASGHRYCVEQGKGRVPCPEEGGRVPPAGGGPGSGDASKGTLKAVLPDRPERTFGRTASGFVARTGNGPWLGVGESAVREEFPDGVPGVDTPESIRSARAVREGKTAEIGQNMPEDLAAVREAIIAVQAPDGATVIGETHDGRQIITHPGGARAAARAVRDLHRSQGEDPADFLPRPLASEDGTKTLYATLTTDPVTFNLGRGRSNPQVKPINGSVGVGWDPARDRYRLYDLGRLQEREQAAGFADDRVGIFTRKARRFAEDGREQVLGHVADLLAHVLGAEQALALLTGGEAEGFAEEDWTQQRGPRGGTFWLNSKTGAKKYTKTNPGKGKEKAKKEEGGGKAAAVTLDDARQQIAAVQQDPTPRRAFDLAQSLAALKVAELAQLKKELGVKGGGRRKAELVDALRDKLFPEEGEAEPAPAKEEPKEEPKAEPQAPQPESAPARQEQPKPEPEPKPKQEKSAPPAPKGWEPPLGSTPGPAPSADGSRGGVHADDAKKVTDAVKDVFSLGSVAEWGLAPAAQLHQAIQQRTGKDIDPEAFRGFLKRAEEMRAIDWHITNETGQVTGDELANKVASWNAGGGVQNEVSIRSYSKLADAWQDYASQGGVSPPAAGDTPPEERASGMSQARARAEARKQAGLPAEGRR